MRALPNRHDVRHHKAIEEESDPRTPGEKMLRTRCGQQVSSTAGKDVEHKTAEWRQ